MGSVTKTIKTKLYVPSRIEKINYESFADAVTFSWEPVEDAISYIIKEYNSSDKALATKLNEYETTDTTYTLESYSRKSKYITVTAVNDSGRSSESIIQIGSIGDFKFEVTTIPDRVSTTVSINTDNIKLKNSTLKYIITSNSSYSNGEYYYNEDEIVDSSTDNELVIKNLKVGNSYSYYAWVLIMNGEEVKAKDFSRFDFFTKGLPACSNANLVSTTRTTATVSFTPLPDDQLYGVNPSTVQYKLQAINGSSVNEVKTEIGSTKTELIIDKLEPDTNYIFKISTYSSLYDKSFTESEVYSFEGRTKAILSKPMIKTIEEVSGTAPMSNLKVNFDAIAEDEDEDIKYGIQYKVLMPSAYTKTDVIPYPAEGYIPKEVNGGNRYYVQLFAYSEDDPDAIVYSEVETIQFLLVNDINALSLVYTDDDNIVKMLDIANAKTWENGVPLSTATEYNWGLIDPRKDTEDTSDDAVPISYSIKLGLTNNMLEKTVKIFSYYNTLFSYTINGESLSSLVDVYFIIPGTEKAQKYIEDATWKMPDYTQTLIKTPCNENSGIIIEDKYLFNNSLYLGITQSGNGYVGFSYYYY